MCTTTISVLVNDIPINEFAVKRGLRQGDHLSPFLLLLEADGLNVMMRVMIQSNIFTGYNIGFVNSTIISIFSSSLIRYF